LTIEDLRDELSARFEKNKPKGATRKEFSTDEEEKVFYAGGKFKGKCNKCGKYGHKAAFCETTKGKDDGKKKGKDGDDSKPKTRFLGKCYNCGKSGHRSSDWLAKKKDKDDGANAASGDKKGRDREDDDVVLVADFGLSAKDLSKDLWLGDSGASCHMTCSDAGMKNCKSINMHIRIGDGKLLKATKIGDKHVTVRQKDGKYFNIVLKDCKYVPDLFVNLFSITKTLDSGWKLSNEGVKIKLSKSNTTIKFDQVLPTDNGVLVGVKMVSRNDVAMLASGKLGVNYEDLHRLLGHTSKEIIKKTGEYYKIPVRGEFPACVDCALSKAKLKNVGKLTEDKSLEPAARLYIDVSSVQFTSYGGSKYWLLIVDDYSDYCWSIFLKTKDMLSEAMIDFINQLQKEGKTVKKIRLDNSGENRSFAEECKKEKDFNVHFEFAGPGSPQYNGRVERKFATLYAKVRSMLNGAKVTPGLRQRIWSEAASTATEVENVLITTSKSKPSYELFYGKPYPNLDTMRTFGELAIVEDNKNRKIRAKLKNRGLICMYMGRARYHTSDVYRFLNLSTHKILMSRDVTWLHKFYDQFSTENPEKVSYVYDEQDDEDDEEDYVVVRDVVIPTIPPAVEPDIPEEVVDPIIVTQLETQSIEDPGR
jgi:Zinc knuckle